ncbi:ABC transporter transmembrane region 2-domain-containing protein [Pavlovales sp. CCMP2436]|nr:ABC transporter transmembrane region 2-domain-containing protein [Pavlovales sp. CCMP2436]
MALGRTRGSLLVLAGFYGVWLRGMMRSLRVGDKLFELLRLCFGPKLRSRESAAFAALVSCTFARTLLSMVSADCSGRVARALIEARWAAFAKHTAVFALLGVPAASVNAGLKYCTRMMALLFQRRLSRDINSRYIRGSNFFKAAHLPGCKIDNVDQRVTSDIERFAESAASLLTTVFKPSLDVTLLTMRLGRSLGVHAPAVVIGASLVISQLKLRLLPDVKRLAQQESEVAGLYRSSHARLIASAEEIALFQGGRRERALLDTLMGSLFRASVQLSRHQLLLGVFDQYMIKTGSPVIAWVLQARRHGSLGERPLGEIVANFVRTGAQLADLGSAVGHLVQASTKVASLAGITTRISEVIEAVHSLEAAGNNPFQRRQALGGRAGTDEKAALAAAPLSPGATGAGRQPLCLSLLAAWRRAVEELDEVEWGPGAGGPLCSDDSDEDELGSDLGARKRRTGELCAAEGIPDAADGGGRSPGLGATPGGLAMPRLMQIVSSVESGQMRRVASWQQAPFDSSQLGEVGGAIVFEKACAARVRASVRLCVCVFPLVAGSPIQPPASQMLFVPQRPYLVLGSLRDQLTYPLSHEEAVAKHATATAAVIAREEGTAHLPAGSRAEALDVLLRRLLCVVDPAGSLLAQFGLDEVRDWRTTLSGGQKQRVGMCRLFYHTPRYAVLDECTSAVSVEVEARIYQACRALGISLFTVSHKIELMRRFHDYQLNLDGQGGWEWTDLHAAGGGGPSPAAAATTPSARSPALP